MAATYVRSHCFVPGTIPSLMQKMLACAAGRACFVHVHGGWVSSLRASEVRGCLRFAHPKLGLRFAHPKFGRSVSQVSVTLVRLNVTSEPRLLHEHSIV